MTLWTVEERAWKQELPYLPDDVIALLATPVVVTALPRTAPVEPVESTEADEPERYPSPLEPCAVGASPAVSAAQTAVAAPAASATTTAVAAPAAVAAAAGAVAGTGTPMMPTFLPPPPPPRSGAAPTVVPTATRRKTRRPVRV